MKTNFDIKGFRLITKEDGCSFVATIKDDCALEVCVNKDCIIVFNISEIQELIEGLYDMKYEITYANAIQRKREAKLAAEMKANEEDKKDKIEDNDDVPF